jgi:hypothetical protein
VIPCLARRPSCGGSGYALALALRRALTGLPRWSAHARIILRRSDWQNNIEGGAFVNGSAVAAPATTMPFTSIQRGIAATPYRRDWRAS